MKPFFSFVSSSLALLLLAGCGLLGDEEKIPTDNELQTITTQGVSIGKPPSWNFIEQTEKPEDFPKGVLFLMSSVEPWGQGTTFATVAVATEQIPLGTSSRKYAEAAAQKTEQEVINFEKVGEETVTIDGNEGKLLQFRGKNKAGEDTLEWQHLFVAKGTMGYVISSTAPTDLNDEQRTLLKNIVLSFHVQ
jgi:hypothetical protein